MGALAVSNEVWIALGSLLLGYVGSLVTEAFRDQRLTRRERAAREAERQAVKEARREELADRHREFQRQTLLELQEALNDEMRGVAVLHLHDVKASRLAGKWVRTPLGEADSEEDRLASRRTAILQTRVDDAALRGLVRGMKEAGGQLLIASSEEESNRGYDAAQSACLAANERIGELLRVDLRADQIEGKAPAPPA